METCRDVEPKTTAASLISASIAASIGAYTQRKFVRSVRKTHATLHQVLEDRRDFQDHAGTGKQARLLGEVLQESEGIDAPLSCLGSARVGARSVLMQCSKINRFRAWVMSEGWLSQSDAPDCPRRHR